MGSFLEVGKGETEDGMPGQAWSGLDSVKTPSMFALS
jgi:hypothetical protein